MVRAFLSTWRNLHAKRWRLRAPLKLAILLLVLLGVAYPWPNRLARHVRHQLHADALLRPDAPALAPMLAQLRAELDMTLPAADQLRHVQAFVEHAVPYAFDWDVWGVVDYLPTVEEVMSAGREDCDGRAVIAASLLRGLGYDAHLAANPLHVWVWTPAGETMSPQTYKLVDTTQGRLHIDWRGLRAIPEGFAFGVGVFPIVREWVIVAALWLLLLTPRSRRVPAVTGLIFLAASLMALRRCATDFPRVSWSLLGMACALFLIGVILASWKRPAILISAGSESPSARPSSLASTA